MTTIQTDLDLDLEIDLRDGHQPTANATPQAPQPTSPDPGPPVRVRRRPSSVLLASVRRSLHIGAWVAVVAVVVRVFPWLKNTQIIDGPV